MWLDEAMHVKSMTNRFYKDFTNGMVLVITDGQ